MVTGMLEGLGDVFGVAVDVHLSRDRANGADYDEFLVRYHAC